MHFTVYNGLQNCPLGNLTMFQKDGDKKINEIWFDFTNASTKYYEVNNAEQGQWYFSKFSIDCEDYEIYEFDEVKFAEKFPTNEEEDDGDSGQHILISWDTLNEEGFIQESKYKERIDKSATGLPIVK